VQQLQFEASHDNSPIADSTDDDGIDFLCNLFNRENGTVDENETIKKPHDFGFVPTGGTPPPAPKKRRIYRNTNTHNSSTQSFSPTGNMLPLEAGTVTQVATSVSTAATGVATALAIPTATQAPQSRVSVIYE